MWEGQRKKDTDREELWRIWEGFLFFSRDIIILYIMYFCGFSQIYSIFPWNTLHSFGVASTHPFIHSVVIYRMFTLHKALRVEKLWSFKTAVILSSCFVFLGSGLSCIGLGKFELLIYSQNWELPIHRVLLFTDDSLLMTISWRITLFPLPALDGECVSELGSPQRLFRACDTGNSDPTSVEKQG